MKCTCDKEVCDINELCQECAAEYQSYLDEQNELFAQAMEFSNEDEKNDRSNDSTSSTK